MKDLMETTANLGIRTFGFDEDGPFEVQPKEKDVTEKLIIPLVHMNGSGKKNLVEGYVQASRLVQDAMTKIAEAYPHMRDYYPLDNGDNLFKIAQEQHYTRIDKLREVVLELNALALGVHTQDGKNDDYGSNDAGRSRG